MQEGKNAGLSGSISGAAETYWGKNKGRSMEGTLVLITRILAGAFIVLSIVLNMLMLSLETMEPENLLYLKLFPCSILG